MTSKYQWCEDGKVDYILLALTVLQNHASPSKITIFCLTKCFSVYDMEVCNVKCYDLLMLLETPRFMYFMVEANGSVELLICVPLPHELGNLDIFPTWFKLSTKCQTVEHM